MPDLLIVAKESQAVQELRAGLEQADFVCSVVNSESEASKAVSALSPDIVLVEVGRFNDGAWDFIRGVKRECSLPVIALLAGGMPDNADRLLDADDFLLSPYSVKELAARAQRLLRGSESPDGGALIKCNNLVINLTNCDVTVGGKLVELTFKEYELLKLLAGNRGRVYTREDLLNKVWGYDYFGGDRTVDVHVRRLRSKIEGPTDTFIETVRNMGYRFKKN